MSLFKRFGGDRTLETSGVEINYGKNERTGNDIIIIVARSGGSNTKFQKVMSVVMKPYGRQLQNNILETSLFRSLMAEVFAKSVILGWKEVDDADGNPLPFNEENCKNVLISLPDLFDDIQEVAGSQSAFRRDAVEEDAKN